MSDARDLVVKLQRGLTIARLFAGDSAADVAAEAAELGARTQQIKTNWEAFARDLAGCTRAADCACAVCTEKGRASDGNRT